jgi:hypothetical protein
MKRYVVLFLLLIVAAGCNKRGSDFIKVLPAPAAAPPGNTAAPPPNPAALPAERPPPAPEITDSRSPQPGDTTTENKEPVASELTLPGRIIYAENFDTAAGAGYRIVRGERERVDATKRDTIRIYPFYDPNQKEELILHWHEDDQNLGPDGKPGVLALIFENLPPGLQYSGFSYVGRTQDPQLALEPLAKATSADSLRGVRVRFRYRTLNPYTNDGRRVRFGIRLEAMVPDSYNKRLDLKSILATDEWLAFEADLGEAGNIDAFVNCIQNESPTAFKLLFAQGEKAETYKPGDTLLIDNIEFVVQTGDGEKQSTDPPHWDEFSKAYAAIPAGALVSPLTDQVKKDWSNLGRQFRRYRVEEARSIVQRLAKEAEAELAKRKSVMIDTHNNLYVLNRFYFAVPEWELRSNGKQFGFKGVPTRDGEENLLWPLETDSNSQVFLASPFQGYFGAQYDAVGEFDHFNRVYGPRVPFEK